MYPGGGCGGFLCGQVHQDNHEQPAEAEGPQAWIQDLLQDDQSNQAEGLIPVVPTYENKVNKQLHCYLGCLDFMCVKKEVLAYALVNNIGF